MGSISQAQRSVSSMVLLRVGRFWSSDCYWSSSAAVHADCSLKKNGRSTWQDGISHQLWSGDDVSCLCSTGWSHLKMGEWVSTAPLFFFFSLLLTPLAFSLSLLDLNQRWDEDFEYVTVSSPVFHTCECSNPRCNFPNFVTSRQRHRARSSNKGGERSLGVTCIHMSEELCNSS